MWRKGYGRFCPYSNFGFICGLQALGPEGITLAGIEFDEAGRNRSVIQYVCRDNLVAIFQGKYPYN